MFRTSNIRGQKRFDYFRFSKLKKNGKLELNQTQIELIEKSSAITLGEKIELLLVALGNKLTTEIYSKICYSGTEPQQANKEDLDKIKKLLEQLPFVYFKDKLANKKNRITGKTENFAWFQVSVNESVAKFMKIYPDDLTEFEEGVLYGFPLSAIRSFARLVDESHDKPNPASHFLSGWCSKDFWDDEQEYYKLWWKRLSKLSPKVVQLAETKFKQQYTN